MPTAPVRARPWAVDFLDCPQFGRLNDISIQVGLGFPGSQKRTDAHQSSRKEGPRSTIVITPLENLFEVEGSFGELSCAWRELQTGKSIFKLLPPGRNEMCDSLYMFRPARGSEFHNRIILSSGDLQSTLCIDSDQEARIACTRTR